MIFSSKQSISLNWPIFLRHVVKRTREGTSESRWPACFSGSSWLSFNVTHCIELKLILTFQDEQHAIVWMMLGSIGRGWFYWWRSSDSISSSICRDRSWSSTCSLTIHYLSVSSQRRPNYFPKSSTMTTNGTIPAFGLWLCVGVTATPSCHSTLRWWPQARQRSKLARKRGVMIDHLRPNVGIKPIVKWTWLCLSSLIKRLKQASRRNMLYLIVGLLIPRCSINCLSAGSMVSAWSSRRRKFIFVIADEKWMLSSSMPR